MCCASGSSRGWHTPCDRGGVRRAISLFLVACVASLPALSWAEPSAPPSRGGEARELRLTAKEVADRAVKLSPEVGLRFAEVDAAASEVDQALVAFFPRLQATARYARLSAIDAPVVGYAVVAPGLAPSLNPAPVPAGEPLAQVPLRFPNILNQTSFQASVTIPLSDYLVRLVHGYTSAQSRERARSWEAEAARAKVRAEARVLFYAWVRAQAAVEVAKKAVLQARSHLADSQRALENQAAARADGLMIRAKVSAAEQLEGRARNLVRTLEAQLRVLIGTEVELVVAEDVSASIAPLALANTVDLLSEAASKRPELRALTAARGATDEQSQYVRASGWPRLDLLGEATVANPNPRYLPQSEVFRATWSIGAQITWSPSDTFAAGAAARGLDAKARAFGEQRRAALNALRLEITEAVGANGDAILAQGSTARELEAAEELLRTRRLAFQLGKVTRADLADAEGQVARAELEALGSRLDARITRVRLLHALGRDVAD